MTHRCTLARFSSRTYRLSRPAVVQWRMTSGSSSGGDDALRVNDGVKGVEVNLPNHRFWTQSISSSTATSQDKLLPFIAESVEKISSERFIELGMAIVLSEKSVQLVPIHQGKMQSQHSVNVHTHAPTGQEIVVCGFRPRATHIPGGVEQERPIDASRLRALNEALSAINSATEEELLGEDLAGTPPARIFRYLFYQYFVSSLCHRHYHHYILDPLYARAQVQRTLQMLTPRSISAHTSRC